MGITQVASSHVGSHQNLPQVALIEAKIVKRPTTWHKKVIFPAKLTFLLLESSVFSSRIRPNQ
jgi:hypothetical protein